MAIENWEPLRLVVESNNRIRAVATIFIRKIGRLSFIYVPRGPVLTAETDIRAFQLLLRKLRELAFSQRAVAVKLNPAITKPSSVVKIFRNEKFLPSCRREMHISTYRINLTKKEDQLWLGLRGTTRTAIRSARKQSIIIDRSNQERNLEDFYQLYQSLRTHKQIAIHSYQFIHQVWRKFSPRGDVRVFVAYYQRLPIAVAFVFTWSKMCEYMWGATKKEYQKFNAGHLLHWEIICWAKNNGFLVYDLGGAPSKQNKKLHGLSLFKQGFGGEFTEFIGEYEFCYLPFYRWVWNYIWPVYHKTKLLIKRKNVINPTFKYSQARMV